MRRILVIEDEFLLALHIEAILIDEGHEVIGPFGALDVAMDVANEAILDGALLDVNIGGGRVDAVAAILDRRGVPFIFVTSCERDDLPHDFRDTVLVNKPFRDEELAKEVRRFASPSVAARPMRVI